MAEQAKPTTIEIHDQAFDVVATIKNPSGIAAAFERLGAAVLGPSSACRCDEVSRFSSSSRRCLLAHLGIDAELAAEEPRRHGISPREIARRATKASDQNPSTSAGG